MSTIKFITEAVEKKTPMFGDVELNQFFVNNEGCLCQKTAGDIYSLIALSGGSPYSDQYRDIPNTGPITRILPHVTKIEF